MEISLWQVALVNADRVYPQQSVPIGETKLAQSRFKIGPYI
jgi:hypothetical protein